MKDLIWTIIAIWLIYKIVDVFRIFSSQKDKHAGTDGGVRKDEVHEHTSKEQEMKSALKKHLNNEGEYVDFEEIK